jgi:GNAT superfamily N-acetyltransferase
VDDAEALAGIHVRGWQWGYRGQLPEEFLSRLSVERRVEQWRAWLLDPGDTATWVAEEGVERAARTLGFVAAGANRDPDPPPDTGEVYAIYLEREAAGRGIGAALLRQACAWLAAEGFTRASLWVLDSNARARDFYERSGWRADGGAKTDPLEDFEIREVRYVTELPGGGA